MKRFGRILVIFFALLVITVLVFPSFFKSKVKQAVLDAFAQNVNAELFFSDVSLSLIPNFPDFTIGIEDMGIVGVGLFEGDTLVSAAEASITVDIMDVISGEELGAKSIVLEEPSITILTLADGSANYDIAKESEETEVIESETESGDVSFAIQSFEVADGEFIYFDQSTEVFIQLEEINVKGDGNFENDIFDLITTGTLNLYDFNYAGTDYVEDKEVDLNVTLGMDLINSVYTFKENQLLVNTFPLHADGSFSLLEDGFGMDLTFDAPGASFTQLLSLVPGIYQSSMEGLDANGALQFNGAVKGEYNENSMPAFDFGMSVSDGDFAYAGYPERIQDFNLNLKVNNASGIIEETKIEVSPMRLRVGDSPFELGLTIENLSDYAWDLLAKGTLDLALVNALYPQDGVTLVGGITSNINSSGNYTLVEKEAYDQLPFSGDIQVNDFVFNDPELIDLSISSADLKFNNNEIVLSEFNGKTKSTSFQAQGKVSDFIGFALADDVLKGEFTGKADKLDINEWMVASEEPVEETSEEVAYEVVRIPENIDFKTSVSVDEIIYNDLSFKNAKGALNVEKGIVSFDETGMDVLNGSVGLSGTYNSVLEKPFFDLGLAVKDISIPQSFQSVSMVQTFAPVAKNMSGLFNSNFSISGVLGEDFMPDLSSISGSGLIEVLEASLGNSNILSGLSGVTKLADVATATLDKVKMQAEIKDGKLFVKPFNVTLGDYQSQVSGSTGIDGNIDYTISMNVPSGKVGAQVNTLVSNLAGSQQSLVGQNLVMNVGMTGSFLDPKFGIRSVTSEKGETYKEQVTNQVKAEVKAKTDSVKQVAEDKVTAVKDSANTLVNAKKDSLAVLADSLVNAKKDTLSTLAADKLGVNKDSVDSKLKDVKDKAKGALKGLLKKKKKDN